MTKYSEDEVVSFLKTLKLGDCLTCVKQGRGFVLNCVYEVKEDNLGGLFITDSHGNKGYIGLGGRYAGNVYDSYIDGIFSIPQKDKEEEEEIISVIVSTKDGDSNIVTIHCNDIFLQTLREKLKESKNRLELQRLREEETQIREKIKSLEEGMA